jgi:hypothetical protein
MEVRQFTAYEPSVVGSSPDKLRAERNNGVATAQRGPSAILAYAPL